MATTLSCLSLLPAVGQTPTVQARKIAVQGPSDDGLIEPTIAIGEDIAMVVARGGDGSPYYAILDRASDAWVLGGPIAKGSWVGFWDGSVAYDSVTSDFVTTCYAGQSGSRHVVVSTFDYDTSHANGYGEWSDWQAISPGDPVGDPSIDKPYMIAGEPGTTAQEYYVVWWHFGSGAYEYRHSTDSGANWTGGEIKVGGQSVTGGFAAQPAVVKEDDFYVAYRKNTTQFRFLVGEDQPSGKLTWAHFLDGCDEETPILKLNINLSGSAGSKLPGSFQANSTAQLAADPTSDTRLYVAYHDLAGSTSTDMNVYVQRLDKHATGWCLGTKVQVNDDTTIFESDQFLPAITVDEEGRVHVIFYDDRNYTDGASDIQPDNSANPKFDVYYAYSTNQGAAWENAELLALPAEPALDQGLQNQDPREYIGIGYEGDVLYGVYTGTSTQDTQSNKAVISANKITWP